MKKNKCFIVLISLFLILGAANLQVISANSLTKKIMILIQ